MPVAETKRLILRPVRAGDAAGLEAVFCCPEVMRFSEGVKNPAWVRAWIGRMIEERYPTWGFGLWSVVRRADERVIGYCGLMRLAGRCDRDEAELGFRLAKDVWGRGYATEAAAAACNHGLQRLALPRVIAIVDPENRASIRILEKIGMTYERDVMFDGYSHPDRLYATSSRGPSRSARAER